MPERTRSPSMELPHFQPLGDCGLLVTLGHAIDEEAFQTVRKSRYAVTHPPIGGVTETIPGYVTLFLAYDPTRISFRQLAVEVQSRLKNTSDLTLPPPESVTIPVAYGGEFGPDLTFVAEYNHLSPEEVIRIHASGRYPVFMLGFTPGFPYLGGMSERIAAPRLESPRAHVPAGSVGIANNQTGIYPVDSPGGWRIIGRTPMTLFNPGADDPFLIKPGQIVRFTPITHEEFHRIRGNQP